MQLIDIIVHPVRWLADTNYRLSVFANRPVGVYRVVSRPHRKAGKVETLLVFTVYE